MIMNRLVVLIALMVAAWPLAADAQGTIQGSVTSARTMQPLAGVQVFVPGLNVGTLTNAQGNFQLLNVPAGTRVVRASLIGFGSEEETVQVPASGAVTVTLELTESALALEGVVVTALGMERQARALGVAAQQVDDS